MQVEARLYGFSPSPPPEERVGERRLLGFGAWSFFGIWSFPVAPSG